MSENNGDSEDADDIGPDVVGPERTLRQAFKLWITPEIERRVNAGTLTLPVDLQAAQVLFHEGRHPEIRLNNEVRGSPLVRISKPVQVGDNVSFDDIEKFEALQLDEEEADAGHFTVIRRNDGWVMLFDFQRNKRKASELVELGEQFLAVAEYALSNKFLGPYIDNLFSACELLSKARLITADQTRLKTHVAIHSKINLWQKLGNADSKFVELFNELSNLRPSVRYGGSQNISLEADGAVGHVRAEIARLRFRIARFGTKGSG
jgi:hypothetical protein